MRSIFHEILARYLDTDQYAFRTSTRELWPDSGYVPSGEALEPAQKEPAERNRSPRIYGELEPQN